MSERAHRRAWDNALHAALSEQAGAARYRRKQTAATTTDQPPALTLSRRDSAIGELDSSFGRRVSRLINPS